jgi:hypothetical protein
MTQPEWRPPQRLGKRLGLWLPIILLHGLLLLAHLPRASRVGPSDDTTLVVQLLPTPAPPRRAAPASPAVRAAAAPAPRLAAPGRTQPATAPTHASDQPPASSDDSHPAPVAAAPADADPAPLPLIQTEATRQAIRLATRAPLLSERAASASEAPARETAQQRFGREVARTAYGNCLKGEFPGAGAGLLSLPMFLIAEASGRCQK